MVDLSTLICPTLETSGEPAHCRPVLEEAQTLGLQALPPLFQCSKQMPRRPLFPLLGPELHTRMSELDSSVDNT